MKVKDLVLYGVSEEYINTLLSFNLTELYPPQEEAIKKGILCNNTSFVISSPTASGKTFIAEMTILKTLLEKTGKVIYLVPLKALANEKFEEFSSRYKPLGFRVSQSTGDYDSLDPWLEKSDIIISTNEKMDSLIRHRVSWLMDVSLVIADEVHLMGDPNRGPTLEIVLVRLKSLNPRIRLITLSATVPNAIEIANWLKATLVESTWRPVPLKEGVYFGGTIVFKDGSMRWVNEKTKVDMVNLAIDTIEEDGQVLIFVNTRKSTEATAHKVSIEVGNRLSEEDKTLLTDTSQEILNTLSEPTRVCKKLSEYVAYGAAFHHAGLHYKQRKLIENNFKDNKIKTLTSTTTLAMGLNLPSRRVIIRDWRRYESGYGMRPIPVMEIKQMSGRAGRPKYDDYGEAIIIAKDKREEKFIFENYIMGKPECIDSQLGSESVLRTHVLASIAGLFAMSEGDLFNFMGQTFFAFQRRPESLHHILRDILFFLEREGMIEKVKSSTKNKLNSKIRATRFGERVSQLYIDPLSAAVLRDTLILAEEKNIMTPFSFFYLLSTLPDMMVLTLKKKDLREMQLLFKKHRDELLTSNDYPTDDTLAQIKTATALMSWIDENSEDLITGRFEIGPGDLYTMVERSDWLLYSSSEISKIFNLKEAHKELTRLRKRVAYGIKEELLPLVNLDGVGRVRGRNLYQAGYKSLKDLMQARVEDISRVPAVGKALAESIKKQVSPDNSFAPL